jgi:hypothetical protein
MKSEGIKQEWKVRWERSLEEMLAGISAKYKQLVGIGWLNVHRLFDLRRWRESLIRLPHRMIGDKKAQM